MDREYYKPKLVFFQGKHSRVPKFMQHHLQLHVKCLQEYFDVVLINSNCDYDKVCNEHQPELVLFEGGWRSLVSEKITIRNTSSHPSILKLGLHNGDGWCECRVDFFADMEKWGVENFVSICTTTAEHTPMMAENMFVWPNFIDESIYRDYYLAKKIPVLFTGAVNSLYPWRQKAFKILSRHYPSVTMPHLGYDSLNNSMKYGESYARLINSSWFVPTCGTVAKEFVRKHLEIPGSKSCLITEKTPFLETAGFVDMKNCVFSDESDLQDKLHYLLKNRDELENIIEAGFGLVHSKHTLKQRDQILQWFTLHKKLKQNQKIVQTNPFERLKVVDLSTKVENTPIVCNGAHLRLLQKGDERLQMGKYEEAEGFYMQSLNYINWMSEINLKLGICNLYMGKAENAIFWISRILKNELQLFKALQPDPIEWAYYIISLLCMNRLNEAIVRANQFPSLSHPELERTRLIVQYLQDRDRDKVFTQNGSSTKYRRSIHQMPALGFEEWINNVILMLSACKQQKYAAVLSTLLAPQQECMQKLTVKSAYAKRSFNNYLFRAWAYNTDKLNGVLNTLHIPEAPSGLPSIYLSDYMIRLARYLKLNVVARRIHGLKNTFTSLPLPAKPTTITAKSVNPIQDIFETAHPATILMIGAAAIDCLRKTLSCKMPQDPAATFIYLDLDISNNQFPISALKSCEFTPASLNSFSNDLNAYIRKVKQENGIDQFDMVCLDNAWLFQNEPIEELELARILIMSRWNAENGGNNRQELINGYSYQVLSQSQSNENGYAIFKNNNEVLSSVSSL